MDLSKSSEWRKAQRGELYRAFVPELVAARDRCYMACHRFNTTSDLSRRNLVRLWREITVDPTPLPPLPDKRTAVTATATTTTDLQVDTHKKNEITTPTDIKAGTNNTDEEADAAQFEDSPWVLPPLHADYGSNIKISAGVFINYNSSWVDTCPITIGSRTLIGPNCSFYSGTHPTDPAIRNGLQGPETGAPIVIGEDCWFGGNVIVLPGVTVGRGCTVGAGSVLTKDVPDFCVVAGNPARFLRKVDTVLDSEHVVVE